MRSFIEIVNYSYYKLLIQHSLIIDSKVYFLFVSFEMESSLKNFLTILEVTNSSKLSFSSKEIIKDQNLSYNIENFYMNDSISRSSETMANCTNEILKKAKAS